MNQAGSSSPEPAAMSDHRAAAMSEHRLGMDEASVDHRPATLRFFEVASYARRPKRATRASRVALVKGGHTRRYTAAGNEPLLPLLANRRWAKTIGASRRSVLKGLLTVASGAAASATAALGPGRALAAQDKIVVDGATPYRIVSGCGSSFEETNCRPGCQGAPVCNHRGCCSPEGWFRNEPSEGFMPLGFESQSCITAYADGSGGLLGDGWLWEYRPDLDGADANSPCSHCTVMVTRCHDGRYFDADTGVWEPGICRAEISCEPSGRPQLPDTDDDVSVIADEPKAFNALGALDSILDQGAGELAVTGWAYNEDYDNDPDPVEVVVTVDDWPQVVVAANLARRDVAVRQAVGCCHGFVAAVAKVAAGKRKVCVFARRGTQQVLIGCADIDVADYDDPGDSDAADTETDPVTAAVPTSSDAEASDRLATGGIEVLIPGPYGGAYASGWAYDPDTTEPVAVVATVDGTLVASGFADLARRDVAYLAPERAAASGWTLVIPYLPADPDDVVDRPDLAVRVSHEVCIYAIDATDGRRRLLGCREVASSETWSDEYPTSAIGPEAAEATPPSNEATSLVAAADMIQGALETAVSPTDGMVVVTGWCYEPGGPVDIEVVVNNTSRQTLQANEERSDIASVFASDGNHGFRSVVTEIQGTVLVEVFVLDNNGERVGLLGVDRVFVG